MTARAAQGDVVRGTVDTVYYASPQWSSGRLAVSNGGAVRFAGKLYARAGDLLTLHGRWTRHPQYGRQFDVTSMEYDLPLDIDGLAHYLANHPDVKGIGPAKARVLAERYGHAFDRALDDEPVAMAAAAHVPVESILALRDVWQANALMNRASAWLASYELTHHQVSSLLKRLGNNAVALLKEDPYLLVGEVPGFGFKRVDKVALKMGVTKAHDGRVRAGVLETVREAIDAGHCWLEYQALVEETNALLTMDDLDSWQWVADAVDTLVREGALAEVHHGGRLVTTPVMLEMERFLAAAFRGARTPNIHFSDEQDIDGLIQHHAPTLNAGQRAAAMNALTFMVSLVSGGAGSGKTYTIKAILDLCELKNLRVVLAAPTGKAAKRMEQVTGRKAFTIHRLLGYSGRAFRHSPENPLETDVLIVDEMSMVDVPLAWRLFRALQLDRTSVVLVGDHNQLPPVGPGNVLRDLVQRKLVPMTLLEEVVRQAGVLKENSIALLGGNVPKTSPTAWYVFNDLDVPEHLARFICDMYREVLAQKLAYDLVADVQVLTPTHKGPMGTRALNILLQRLLQKMLHGIDVSAVPEGRRPRLLVHDKVIQTRNNYELGVMNGATGIVRDVTAGGGLVIEFDGERVTIPARSPWLQDIELAYALTVHKCVSGNTLIANGNGLVPMSDLAVGIKEGETSERFIPLSTHKGLGAAVSVSNEGEKECIRLQTARGFRLDASVGHKVFAATGQGFAWVPASAILPGDTLVMRRGTMQEHPDMPAQTVCFEGRSLVVDEEMGWVLGVLIGDGNQTDRNDYRVEVTKGAHDLLLHYVSAIQKGLGVRTTIRPVKERVRYSAYFHDKQARMLLHEAGLGFDKAAKKKTPWVIFQSPAAVQWAYLRGLFDTDGGVNGSGVHFTTASEQLAFEVQQLLFANGVVASNNHMTEPNPGRGWSGAWRITISGSAEIRRFSQCVGFDHEMKALALSVSCHFLPEDGFKSNRGFIPFGKSLIQDFRDELRVRGGRNYQGAEILGQLFSRIIAGKANLNHYHVEWLTRQVPNIQDTGPAGAMLREICDQRYVFDRVASTSRLRTCVYDFLVPGDHSYIGNGFINHNCQGSEYPCVIAVIHKSHSFQHHRNLFYTAVTRARKTAIVLGDAWGIRECARKRSTALRQTFLSLAPGWEESNG